MKQLLGGQLRDSFTATFPFVEDNLNDIFGVYGRRRSFDDDVLHKLGGLVRCYDRGN
jgi:hypothetical protein